MAGDRAHRLVAQYGRPPMRFSRCALIAGPAAGLVSVLLLLGTASSDLAVDGDASATLGPILTLSATGARPPDRSTEFGQVAMDPSGNAVFTWLQYNVDDPIGTTRVEARTLSADGVLGPVETL